LIYLPQRTRRGAEVDINEVTGKIVDSAKKVHSVSGPGLLLNFNVVQMKDGIRRMVNNLQVFSAFLCVLCGEKDLL
jgi:hypothetical protein